MTNIKAHLHNQNTVIVLLGVIDVFSLIIKMEWSHDVIHLKHHLPKFVHTFIIASTCKINSKGVLMVTVEYVYLRKF